MKRYEVNNESGAVLVEAAIIAPVLFLVMFFGVDLFMYTQSKTVVTQVAREAALYLATVPGTLVADTPYNRNVFVNILTDTVNYPESEVQDWTLACESDYNFDDCPQLNAHKRIQRMLNSSKVFYEVENSSTTTVYDGNFVTVTVSVPLSSFLSMFAPSVGSAITVRRVAT